MRRIGDRGEVGCIVATPAKGKRVLGLVPGPEKQVVRVIGRLSFYFRPPAVDGCCNCTVISISIGSLYGWFGYHIVKAVRAFETKGRFSSLTRFGSDNDCTICRTEPI
ncbi:hypothetical protein D3C87_1409020 [compost metagenome]